MSWYVYDGLGSVVGEVDVTGSLTATKSHDVYGLTRSVTGTPTSRHGWQGGVGHSSDDETGLVYMRARHYDPEAGRFASEDPAMDGDNWFAYCDNDPISKTDVSGKKPVWFGDYWIDVHEEEYQGEKTRHAHYGDGRKGKVVSEWGSIEEGGGYRHATRSQVKKQPNTAHKSMLKRAGILGAVCSVDAYAENDPLGFFATILDISGDHEDAAMLDRINSM